jgi:serine-type D-Ala-D-Ala carboxypeptidase/endopeptidase (penicillin-binding protein 4)
MRANLGALGVVGTLLVAAPTGAAATGPAGAQTSHATAAPTGPAGAQTSHGTAAPTGPAGAQTSHGTAAAEGVLQSSLTSAINAAGGVSGAYVIDLDTGQALFAHAANVGRIPASVAKVYTTSTALLRFGPNATLTTSVLGRGFRGRLGVWYGNLYLRGGGDPTFGSWSFDNYWYGTGATMQGLVSNLVRGARITALRGRVFDDESYFDSLRSTSESGYKPDYYMEGLLSALSYDKGFADFDQTKFQARPALFAGKQFVQALRAAHVKVPTRTPVSSGRTPAGARLLATVHSPNIATLIQLTNTPSDNFFAEMLLKGIGARFGGAGTTAAGAAVVRAELARKFGVYPRLVDGSGLSYGDSTTPRQVVTVLRKMATNSYFVRSLAIGGETGTLQDEMQGTPAQGRCRGKTGTLSDVANLVGYCTAADGHALAFAFLTNSVSDTNYTHEIEADMAAALADYDG